ncbi:MAG: agmatine deiminase family protein [Bacteroidota bacterium]|nr:agmatine deiminase family protein [Bacteroidota bacterium]
MNTPQKLGYRFPAEWEKHEATWLTYPYLDDSFPGKLDAIYPSYINFIKILSLSEKVRINVPDEVQKQKLIGQLYNAGVNLSQIELFMHPSNDVWCRDHGPAFVINPDAKDKKAIVNWDFNAWGGKYPSEFDNQIPDKIAAHFKLPVFHPGIVMEGGSVEFNGNGTILTSTACLLNNNRNAHLSKGHIEEYLCQYYGAEQILWLGDGIAGDDTDGHIDDITRFVNNDTVVTAVETNEYDENYLPLLDNLNELKKMRLLDDKQLNIIELPMPNPQYWEGRRLPASYANFYIANETVIVPTFRCIQDEVALDILAKVFPDRDIIGIDSVDIVWGFGSFHCLSQQEPLV